MATVELSARATATAMVEVGCSIKRGATGRVIDTLNNEQWECEARVLEWLDAEGDAAANAGRGLVLKGLQQASQIRAAVCFRARNFATSECPRSDSEIGPSPHLRANRSSRC